MKTKIFKVIKFTLYCITLIFLFLSTIFLRRAVIDGVSMNPTFENKEQYLYLRHFNFNNINVPGIKRFDVVIIKHPTYDLLIKRVVGLPGEEVEYKNNTLYINGNIVEQNFKFVSDTRDFPRTKVADNNYFVMGDNRPNSLDSRSTSVGQVNISDIEGISLKNS